MENQGFKASENLVIDKVNISKSYIESHMSQAELFKKYLGEFPVDDWVNTGENFLSPLRIDKTPTCSLYTKNGNMYYKDWNGHFHGDCYNLVCFQNNLPYGDLMGAMKIIIKDYPDRFFGEGVGRDNFIKNVIADVEAEEKRLKQIQIKKQPWRLEQVEYWKQYHIPSSLLAKYNIFSCEYMWLEGQMHYAYKRYDPAIAYYFGPDTTGHQRYKIYFPLREKGRNRFITNSNAIQGYSQLPPTGDLLILTKSLKDVLVLDLLGYTSVALQSEQHNFEQAAFDHLSSRFRKIILLYDNDSAGRNGATKICNKYGLTYIEIPKDYEDCKDISDVAKEYSLDDATACMEELLYYII